MKRFHLHVAVDNLDQSIQFYSALFASAPTVQKTDYAKWMLDDPRVNFAISRRGADIGVNHLGIQVDSDDELKHMQSRLALVQADVAQEVGVACCYAKSDKYWVTDPSGLAWETFHSLGSIPVFGGVEEAVEQSDAKAVDNGCCIPLKPSAQKDAACCVPAPERAIDSARCC